MPAPTQLSSTIPELGANSGSVRIPPLRNIPLSDRIARIVDHPAFQRLRTIRQLGPTHLVYPGATHTRFEHSLGVYGMTARYLNSLLAHPDVQELVDREAATAVLLAGLLHDIGHYPFAHSLEASHVPGAETPRHEDLAAELIQGVPAFADNGTRPLSEIIERDFDIDAARVVDLIRLKPAAQPSRALRFVAQIISSGIDADKADYLERDSLHMGVPYGRNHDHERFISSLCLHPNGHDLAITNKGRASCEIFVFSRYTMFSEAYWHHTVRSVAAMVGEALRLFREQAELEPGELKHMVLTHDDDRLLEHVAARAGENSAAHRLIDALTSFRRQPWKRILTLSRVYDDDLAQDAYERIYHLNGDQLLELRDIVRRRLNTAFALNLAPEALIIDTPPGDKDHLQVPDVVSGPPGQRNARPLSATSRVVQGIADDFIKVVKRIRFFVQPDAARAIEDRRLDRAVRDVILNATLAYSPEPESQQSLLD